ncbi:hypothetical protein AGDE_01469 [Angomonas deanei]|nr:hypothetical protein AGDE_01469 [Angomonas deanei]|eukprot:EPY42454.1 hypothetical protein AGDE_01469 [Angomonas deanei]
MYLDVLERRFGKRSNRVRHLKGLCFEAEGKIEEAKKVYDVVRKESAVTDYFAVKRLSAILKAEGKYREAIDILEDQEVYEDDEDDEEQPRKYRLLEIHRADVNIYKELSHLYFLSGSLDKATFYLEETLLSEPNSYLTHARLGELYYAKKDYPRCAIEYSQSLLYNSSPNNARAAYGLWQVSYEQLKLHNGGVVRLDAEKLKQTEELQEYATELLHTLYAKSSTLPALEAFLTEKTKK